jgi:ankyrin repeat protein
MQLAVSDGHVTTVKVLLDAGADVESVRRITLIVPPYRLTVGNSVLLNASQKGHSEIVKLLLSKGADANAISWPSDNNPITDWGKTALMMAAEAGHTTVVRALLAANADVNQQRWYQDKRQSRTYLIRQGDGRTALMYAAVKGNTEIIEDLLRSGARINTADIGGDTALQLAREEGHKTVVQLLKKRGAE